jgi:hypothetical protein
LDFFLIDSLAAYVQDATLSGVILLVPIYDSVFAENLVVVVRA